MIEGVRKLDIDAVANVRPLVRADVFDVERFELLVAQNLRVSRASIFWRF